MVTWMLMDVPKTQNEKLRLFDLIKLKNAKNDTQKIFQLQCRTSVHSTENDDGSFIPYYKQILN